MKAGWIMNMNRKGNRVPTATLESRWNVSGKLRIKMTELSRRLRRRETPTEKKLWDAIRNRQLDGRKFRRQQPIGPFVVDFFCPKEKLIVEVDGGVHDFKKTSDKQRQELLESLGLRFLRVRAEEVEEDIEKVLTKIRKEWAC